MADLSDSFGFGDTVRIKQTEQMLKAQIAGLEGEILGFTTPSVSGVVVTGQITADFAWNIHVHSIGQEFWLDPSNIEFVSRPDVMEMTVGGTTIRVTHTEEGYKEEIVSLRPWWKFW